MADVGRPTEYTREELGKKVDEYFKWCDSQVREYEDKKGRFTTIKKPYTWLGLAIYLGISRDTLWRYSKLDKFSDILTRANERCELDSLEGAMNGIYNDRMVALNLSSNYGYSNKSEVVTTKKEVVSIEDIEAKQQALYEELKKKYTIEAKPNEAIEE